MKVKLSSLSLQSEPTVARWHSANNFDGFSNANSHRFNPNHCKKLKSSTLKSFRMPVYMTKHYTDKQCIKSPKLCTDSKKVGTITNLQVTWPPKTKQMYYSIFIVFVFSLVVTLKRLLWKDLWKFEIVRSLYVVRKGNIRTGKTNLSYRVSMRGDLFHTHINSHLDLLSVFFWRTKRFDKLFDFTPHTNAKNDIISSFIKL